jgi:hypothetical protein
VVDRVLPATISTKFIAEEQVPSVIATVTRRFLY